MGRDQFFGDKNKARSFVADNIENCAWNTISCGKNFYLSAQKDLDDLDVGS